MEPNAENTVEKAIFVRRLLTSKITFQVNESRLIVVTQDWHEYRSKLVFAAGYRDLILEGLKMEFASVPTNKEKFERRAERDFRQISGSCRDITLAISKHPDLFPGCCECGQPIQSCCKKHLAEGYCRQHGQPVNCGCESIISRITKAGRSSIADPHARIFTQSVRLSSVERLIFGLPKP